MQFWKPEPSKKYTIRFLPPGPIPLKVWKTLPNLIHFEARECEVLLRGITTPAGHDLELITRMILN